jgi:hypothetical protein
MENSADFMMVYVVPICGLVISIIGIICSSIIGLVLVFRGKNKARDVEIHSDDKARKGIVVCIIIGITCSVLCVICWRMLVIVSG